MKGVSRFIFICILMNILFFYSYENDNKGDGKGGKGLYS